jgi:hypothetical protein
MQKTITTEVHNHVFDLFEKYPCFRFVEKPLKDEDWHINRYRSAKASEMLFALINLTKLTMDEVKGCFTKNEADLLCRFLYNSPYRVHEKINPKWFILTRIDDKLRYETSMFTEEDISVSESLKSKIEGLTIFQCYSLLVTFNELFFNNNKPSENEINKAFLVECC